MALATCMCGVSRCFTKSNKKMLLKPSIRAMNVGNIIGWAGVHGTQACYKLTNHFHS